MPGTINWDATFAGSDEPVAAEIYNKNGVVVARKPIPCIPPIACPFPMEGLGFSTYTAALAVKEDRYYYLEGAGIITVPNLASTATKITLSSANPIAEVKINVQA